MALFAFPGVAVTTSELGLITEEEAAYYAGRPGVTIRRWAVEGRINRYGSGRGKVRYSVFELNKAPRDEYTRELIAPGEPPELPHRRAA
ncbi:helix-turn-helix domain-containing protein [Streptomyces sp. NPDC004532]